MRILNRLLRKQPLSSLATKIVFLVLVSTFLTALVVSSISVHSTHRLLRDQVDRSFPALLDETSQRTESWLGDGRSELERLAADPALRRFLGDRSPAGDGETPLDESLRRAAYFDTLVVIDPAGELVASASKSDPPSLPRCLVDLAADPAVAAISAIPDAAGATTPAASIPVLQGRDRALGALCGVFHRTGLRKVLASDDIGANGEIYLVDESGQMLSRSGAAGSERVPLVAELSEDAWGKVRGYRNRSGERVVGAAVPLGALGWALVLEQPFDQAFESLFSVITQLVVIDLCIILLFGCFAHRIIANFVQPIHALSEGAGRISRGELDVEVPGGKGSDEIGMLISTFNDMSGKLLHHRTEIHQVNRKLVTQNDELQRANEVLEQLSITDGLTKLHNHRFFQEHLTREIKRVDRTGEPLSLLLLDIDDFKQLNDQFGHAAGDELLVGLAQVLNQSMRDSDLIARYGGDEFAALAGGTDLAGAVNLGEKIRTAVTEAAFIVGDSMRPTRMTISIGVAQYRGSRKQLFRRADRALYRSKDEGKDCVVAEEVEGADTGPGALARET